MDRRDFLKVSAAGATSTLLADRLGTQAVSAPAIDPGQPKIPRWRGFNLTELMGGDPRQQYRETDFQWMAQWGFNFVRLPCSYWTWSSRSNWMVINELPLQRLDRAINLGRQYEIHTNLCLHRIPGYCVNSSEVEPY